MRKRVYKPSSVSPEDPERVIIPLVPTLLPGSSALPGSLERATLQRSSIWSCSGWGLPCQPCRQGCGELLPRLFTLTPLRSASRTSPGGGIFSVALSLGSPPVAVSDHPALWSSDFPPAFGRRSPDPLPHLELQRSKGEKGEKGSPIPFLLSPLLLNYSPIF